MGRRTTPHATTPSPRSSSWGLPDVTIAVTPTHASAAAIARMASIGFCLPAAAVDPPARIVTSPNEASNARSPATFSAHRAQSTASRTRVDDRGSVRVPRAGRGVEGEALRDGVAHRIAQTGAITDEPAELHREAGVVTRVR